MGDKTRDIKALIVAPDDAAEKLLTAELKNHLSDVFTAKSVAAAREAFESKQPPIVVIDDSLSPAERISLVKELCWEEPHVLIALAAGQGEGQATADALKAGASDVLAKPIDLVGLSDLLSRFASAYARRQYKRFSPALFEEVRMDLSLTASTKAVSNAVLLLSQFFSVMFSERELVRIELGFQEVLRNALEHGCLGVDYSQKKELCERAAFDDFVEKESEKARAAGESIKVEAEYLNDRVLVSVLDSGEGFDWRSMKAQMESNSPEEGFSGRGLMLIQRVFDDVAYNEEGNQTILTIRL